MGMPRYKAPTLDKMLRVKNQSQKIGEFLEWLSSAKHYHIARWSNEEEQLVHVSESIETLLAEYFEIDLKQAERERRKILNLIRRKGNRVEASTSHRRIPRARRS